MDANNFLEERRSFLGIGSMAVLCRHAGPLRCGMVVIVRDVLNYLPGEPDAAIYSVVPYCSPPSAFPETPVQVKAKDLVTSAHLR